MSASSTNSFERQDATSLVLRLKTLDTGAVRLYSADWTRSDGRINTPALGRGWNSQTKISTRETFALLFVCYHLYQKTNPNRWQDFRFLDRDSRKISTLLTEGTDVNYWPTKLFGFDELPEEGIQTLLKKTKDGILINNLHPQRVQIYLDDQLLRILDGETDDRQIKALITHLAGDTHAGFYLNRYMPQASKAKEKMGKKHRSGSRAAQSSGDQLAPSRSRPIPLNANQPANGREGVVRPVPDKAIKKNESKLIDHDGERCLVAVRVNGTIQGTGFVVGEGVVVTCAHVVLPDDKTPDDLPPTVRYSIEYLALMGTGAEEDAVSRAVAVQDVELDQRHFSRHSKNDVAFLTWEGRVPQGVKIGRLSTLGNLGGRRCRVKGFAESPPFEILTAVVEVAATGGKRKAEPVLTLNQANSILSGHSGGPLFDCDTNAIVGMVSATNGAPNTVSWHGVEYGFVIKCDTIRSTWPELFRKDRSAEIDQHLTTAAIELRKGMTDCLLRFPRAQLAIAGQLKRSDLVKSDEFTAALLVDSILTELPQDVVPALALAESELRVGPDADVAAANVMIEFYCWFLPGIVCQESRDDLRLMLEQVRGLHRGPVIVPTSSRTILALYLAAMDGVAVKMNRRSAQEAESPGHHVLNDIPEAGFQNANVNKSVIINHLIQQLGGVPSGFADWSEQEQIEEVKERLRLLHATKRTKAIVVSRDLSVEQQETLRETLLYIAIVQLSQKRGSHRILISPFSQGNFPLPS